MISKAELEQLIDYHERLGGQAGLRSVVAQLSKLHPEPVERVVTKIVKVPVYVTQKADAPAAPTYDGVTVKLGANEPASEPEGPKRPKKMERTVERTSQGLVQRVVSDNGNVVEVIRDKDGTATKYVRRNVMGLVIEATLKRDDHGFITEIIERVTES